jgi:V/A-type H+-transporting ATPase subunit G/H
MANNIIEEVKAAEEKAQGLLRQAEEEGRERLLSAEQERIKLINEARRQAETTYQQAIAKAKSEAENIKARIANLTQEQIAKLKMVPNDRLKQAIDLIMKRIKEQWGWHESKKS